MPQGRRCDMGCETWPDDFKYRVCPECGQPTARFQGSNIHPLTEEEAAPKLFEAFYREWDQNMPPTRLDMAPDESVKWDSLYPNGRPSQPASADD